MQKKSSRARSAFRRKGLSRRGLSLVESCALISLSGALAAVFIPTFAKHLRFSKIAEASEQLDDLYRSTAAYYATDRRIQNELVRGCLPRSAGPTPAQPSATPQYVDFASIEVVGPDTWRALGMTTGTFRYSYEVSVAEPGCGTRTAPAYPAVTFRAAGDLDGDGHHSLLERSAAISADQRSLIPIIPLRIIDRVE